MDLNQEELNKILNSYLELSDDAFECSAKNRIKEILKAPFEEARYRVLALLDECVYYSWCSSFGIITLEIIWKQLGGLNLDEDRLNQNYINNGLRFPEGKD